VEIQRELPHHEMVFNLGVGELTVIALLLVIFLGPSTLPDLAQGLVRAVRGERDPEILEPRWAKSDWLLVGGVAILAVLVLTMASVRG
jgi:hypothetical protein